jgi:hypothetical protein
LASRKFDWLLWQCGRLIESPQPLTPTLSRRERAIEQRDRCGIVFAEKNQHVSYARFSALHSDKRRASADTFAAQSTEKAH